MSGNKEEMLDIMQRIRREVKVRSCRFAEKAPICDMRPMLRMPYPRLIMSVSGVKPLVFAEDGEVKEAGLTSGEVLFIGSYCWNVTKWDQDHEKISLVLRNNSYLRFLYIKNNAKHPHELLEEPDCFYHVEDTVSRTTIGLMHSIEAFNKNEHSHSPLLAAHMIECLLDSAIDDMRRSQSTVHGKSTSTWNNVSHYLQDNYLHPLTRSEVAERFHLTPEYVSVLLRKFAKTSFSNYINRLRLAHGAHLLVETDLTLDQISWDCGYSYTSYFIRVFIKHYGVSPTLYRRKGKKAKNTQK